MRQARRPLPLDSLVLLTLSLSLALPAASQKPPQSQITVSGESIDVRVVNIEAVVTDKSGQRVHGLSAADFRLLVDGKEVPPEYFSEIEDGRSRGSSPSAPVAVGEGVPRNYLVYIDDSYSLANRRNAVLDRLEGDLALLGPDDRMAVIAFDGSKLDVLCAWTGDREALRAALVRARQRPTLGGRTLAAQRALARDTTWVMDNAESIETGDSVTGLGPPRVSELKLIFEYFSFRTSPEARTQSGKTVDSMAATLRSFEAPAGRKAMFVLTGAWQMSVAPWIYGPILQAATGEGYAVYPVDTAQSDVTEVTAFDQLAQFTGGRTIVSASGDAFRQVVADSGSFYWLGFSPNGTWSDGAHSIAVEVKRPGLEARFRHAYTDRSPGTEAAQKAESVLRFGGKEENRRLTVELGTPIPKGRKARELEVPVTLGVPIEALELLPEGGGYKAEVQLAIAAEDAEHRRSDLPRAQLEARFHELPRAGGVARFHIVLQLRNAGQRLVFTLRDPQTGEPIWGEAEVKPDDSATLTKSQP